jgi:hypothetical protein
MGGSVRRGTHHDYVPLPALAQHRRGGAPQPGGGASDQHRFLGVKQLRLRGGLVSERRELRLAVMTTPGATGYAS